MSSIKPPGNICRDYTYSRCRRGTSCPYTHDEALQEQATLKSLKTSRGELQASYNKSITTREQFVKNLLKTKKEHTVNNSKLLNKYCKATSSTIASEQSVRNGLKSTEGNSDEKVNPPSEHSSNTLTATRELLANQIPKSPKEYMGWPKPAIENSNNTAKPTGGQWYRPIAEQFCKNYLESRCTNPACPRIHDYLRSRQYLDRATELIYAVSRVDNATNPDNVNPRQALCYYYSTGVPCARQDTPAGCSFHHDLAVRRAVVNHLGGQTISNMIIKDVRAAVRREEAIAKRGQSLINKNTSTSNTNTTLSYSHKTTDVICTGQITPPKTPLQASVKPAMLGPYTSPSSSGIIPTCASHTVATITPPPSPPSKTVIPRHRRKNHIRKIETILPPDDPSLSVKDIYGVVQEVGNWDPFPDTSISLEPKTIEDYSVSREFGEYMAGLKAGESASKMIAKLRKSAPKSEFRNFQLLPWEIRQMVWHYAASSQRTEVRLKFDSKMEFGRVRHVKIRNTNCGAPLLHVNAECREVALKYVEKMFGTQWSNPKVWFNPKRDRVFFQLRYAYELSELARYISPFDSSKVQHMVVPLADFVKHDEVVIAKTILYFNNLKTLTVIYGNSMADKKVLTQKFMDYHTRGIRGCIRTVWNQAKKGHKGPKVIFQEIHAVLAHYYKIDNLKY